MIGPRRCAAARSGSRLSLTPHLRSTASRSGHSAPPQLSSHIGQRQHRLGSHGPPPDGVEVKLPPSRGGTGWVLRLNTNDPAVDGAGAAFEFGDSYGATGCSLLLFALAPYGGCPRTCGRTVASGFGLADPQSSVEPLHATAAKGGPQAPCSAAYAQTPATSFGLARGARGESALLVALTLAAREGGHPVVVPCAPCRRHRGQPHR
jgi:hypothetical protein